MPHDKFTLRFPPRATFSLSIAPEHRPVHAELREQAHTSGFSLTDAQVYRLYYFMDMKEGTVDPMHILSYLVLRPPQVDLEDVRRAQSALERRLEGRYHALSFFARGGTSYLFRATSVSAHTDCLLKVDGPPKNELAGEHMQRGYTVAHELNILRHLDWHIGCLSVLDYDAPRSRRLFSSQPEQGAILVLPFFDPSLTLYEQARFRPLSVREFEHIFSQVLGAAASLEKAGVYHRDIHPLNVLLSQPLGVREDEPFYPQVILLDYGNAVRKKDVQKRFSPTAGSLVARDPSLDFPGKRTFTPASEVYSLTKTMLFALTGTMFADGCSLTDPLASLCQEARRDPYLRSCVEDEHQKEVSFILMSELPLAAAKYGPLIKRGLSLEEHMRFSSVAEFMDHFLFARQC